jgi:competence protein ComGF
MIRLILGYIILIYSISNAYITTQKENLITELLINGYSSEEAKNTAYNCK